MNPKHTPKPWHMCNNGKCKCMTINGDDHPIATVESGEWGDRYSALRIVGNEDGHLNLKSIGALAVEAYSELISYGTIDPEVAQANLRLMHASPVMYTFIMELAQELGDTPRYIRLGAQEIISDIGNE